MFSSPWYREDTLSMRNFMFCFTQKRGDQRALSASAVAQLPPAQNMPKCACSEPLHRHWVKCFMYTSSFYVNFIKISQQTYEMVALLCTFHSQTKLRCGKVMQFGQGYIDTKLRSQILCLLLLIQKIKSLNSSSLDIYRCLRNP